MLVVHLDKPFQYEEVIKQTSTCLRCGRKLSNPHSIARCLGPVCYKKSGGGTFDDDLNADDKEWTRREEHLRSGGEIDLGVNWRYPLGNGFSTNMRVSVRYRDGIFEAYGKIFDPRGDREIIIASSRNLRAVYKAAIAAGPTYTAMAYREGKKRYRELKESSGYGRKKKVAGFPTLF